MAVESRLWRPAAQRNVRNAWSYIQGHRSSWSSASAAALSSATSLVNAYLLHGDVETMEFGVLADMEDIKEKARKKLLINQRTYLRLYLNSYEELVQFVLQMTSAAKSMKTYLNSSGGPLINFTNVEAIVDGDSGDGGGVPVFSNLPMAAHELLASEIVSMFQKELKVKWLLASEFCKLVYPTLEEVYSVQKELSSPFGSEDMSCTSILSSTEQESKEITKEGANTMGHEVKSPKRETLQVYLTALLAEVYIIKDRIEEIGKIYSEEMSVGLFGTP
ncbi:hypothetical protein MPTK1_4g11700 [Marchantia polymorpha subsp. ruderalis]|uniref:Uncharacterized protein n=2 Tax=Marchantia polymorpha TaxID=3197 RepID=A0A176WDV3_MARPO|nr:hypothetical protein AXG93_1962s1160 [Marchantia polymorpha subsp. ruderalis]PTQ46494.1 hypothetical protein MARPO_0011s0155 [Marchantia polymorpha]BBN08458.1 hypothetical protein Mp_4g11700 [Marchantia polymorpha subsp. ruderalis]|eukprot:PTQ46494.1 hypothetical protein MARPO_0011s0155 [Marchantia polymorpha]